MEDANDPELNPKFMGSITADFVKVADALKEASYQLRVRKYSNYPIFPICKTTIEWAQVLYGAKELGLVWNYHISYLEDFVQRNLVEKEDEFKAVYKDPEEFCCLFVVEKDFVNFVFMPYPEDELSMESDFLSI
jgi:hypothetical protein